MEESKGADPLPMAIKLEEEDVTGVWNDSDSEEDERPSRWGMTCGTQPNLELDDCPDLFPSWEEVDEAERQIAEQIHSRQAEAQNTEPLAAAAVPLVPMAVGADAGVALEWATKVATEAEEIINSTLVWRCEAGIGLGGNR